MKQQSKKMRYRVIWAEGFSQVVATKTEAFEIMRGLIDVYESVKIERL